MADDHLQAQGSTKYLDGDEHPCRVAHRMCYNPVLPNLDLPRPPGGGCGTEVGGRQQWSYLAGGGDSEANWARAPQELGPM